MKGIPEVTSFFRAGGDVDVDKDDVQRFWRFVDEKVEDIAIAGRASARWNGYDVCAPQDLPITRGLREQMREFSSLYEADDLRRLLRESLCRLPDDVTLDGETEDFRIEVFGGLSLALARSFGSSTRSCAPPPPRTGTGPSICSGCCSEPTTPVPGAGAEG